MKWATRRNIHVDRAASAWLISTYVDSEAEFVYVDDLDEVPDDATAFDFVGCALSHVGDYITFETILDTNQLDDPILWRIGEIIHEADVEDGRFDAPEAAGFDIMIRALSASHDDETVRAIVADILTSLEQYLRAEALG